MSQAHVYPPLEMPDVEVLWTDDQGAEHWCPGEARMRVTRPDGTLTYDVQYRRPGSTSSHLGTFEASQVRLDTVDRADGRG